FLFRRVSRSSLFFYWRLCPRALPSFPTRRSSDLLEQLSVYADELIARLKLAGGLVDLDTTLSLRKPEVQVRIDREAASDLGVPVDRKSTRLNSSHVKISYAVFCLKKKKRRKQAER